MLNFFFPHLHNVIVLIGNIKKQIAFRPLAVNVNKLLKMQLMQAIGNIMHLISKKFLTTIRLHLNRHIDTAYLYGNEKEVGNAVRAKIAEGVIRREDIFITTKVISNFILCKCVNMPFFFFGNSNKSTKNKHFFSYGIRFMNPIKYRSLSKNPWKI